MSERYILRGHTPVPCEDLLEWARWYETANRRVALDLVPVIDGEVKVSTIFLGLDHNFFFDGPPILFETMVFGGAMHGEQERYCTWEDAEAGHAKILADVREVEELERMQHEANLPPRGN